MRSVDCSNVIAADASFHNHVLLSHTWEPGSPHVTIKTPMAYSDRRTRASAAGTPQQTNPSLPS